MTNRQVFAAFAARKPAQGGSVRVERTSDALVLYSYETPIAVLRDGESMPVFTTRRFSATTSKQQSQARALFGTVHMMDPDQFVPLAKAAGAFFGLAR